MNLEDEILELLNSKDKAYEKALEKAEEEREKAEQEREKAEQEREKAEQEREKAEQEREKAEQEREKAEQERKSKNVLIQKMASLNVPLAEIAEMTQLTIEEVEMIAKEQN